MQRMILILAAALVAAGLAGDTHAATTHRLTDPTVAELDQALAQRDDRLLELSFSGRVPGKARDWLADRLMIRLGAGPQEEGRTLALFISANRDRAVFAEGADALARVNRHLQLATSGQGGGLTYTGYEVTFLKNCKNSDGAKTAGVDFVRYDGTPYGGAANPHCNDIIVTYQAYVSSNSSGQYFKNLSAEFAVGSAHTMNTEKAIGAYVRNDTDGDNWGWVWGFAKAFKVTTSVAREPGFDDPTDTYGWVATTTYPGESAANCSTTASNTVSSTKGWNLGASLTGSVGASATGPTGSVGIGLSAGIDRSTTETSQDTINCAYEEFRGVTRGSSLSKTIAQELKTVGNPYSGAATGDIGSLRGVIDVNVAEGRGKFEECKDNNAYCIFDMDKKEAFPDAGALLPPSVQDGYQPGFFLQMQSVLDADAPKVETFNMKYTIDSYCGYGSSAAENGGYMCGFYANHNKGAQISQYDMLWTNGLGDNKVHDYDQEGGDAPWDLGQIYVDPDESGFQVNWRDHIFYPVKSLYVRDQTTQACWSYDGSAIRLDGSAACPPSTSTVEVPATLAEVFYLLVTDDSDPLAAFKISRYDTIDEAGNVDQVCLGIAKATNSLTVARDVCSDTSTYYTVWRHDTGDDTVCSFNDDDRTLCLKSGPDGLTLVESAAGTPYVLLDPSSGMTYEQLDDPAS